MRAKKAGRQLAVLRWWTKAGVAYHALGVEALERDAVNLVEQGVAVKTSAALEEQVNLLGSNGSCGLQVKVSIPLTGLKGRLAAYPEASVR